MPNLNDFIQRISQALAQQKLEDALLIAQEAIEVFPQSATAMNNYGAILMRLKEHERAEDAFRQALSFKPNHSDALFNLGQCYAQKSLTLESEVLFRRALALNPANMNAFRFFNKLMVEQARYEEMLEPHLKLLEIKSKDGSLHLELAKIYIKLGRLVEAKMPLEMATTLAPTNPHVWANLGYWHELQGQRPNAVEAYQKTLALNPDNFLALNNLGTYFYQTIAQDTAHLDKALDLYERAYAIHPTEEGLLNNFALALIERRQYARAEQLLRQLMAQNPNHITGQYCLGYLQLRLGNHAEGWQNYEARTHREFILQKNRPRPPLDHKTQRWQGESLAGKSLLIWPEQGLGDEIQLVRYLPLIRQAGARRIYLVASASLITLFQASGLADEIYTRENWLKHLPASLDYWDYNFSLPLKFKTQPSNLPNRLPYLSAPSVNDALLPPTVATAKLKVGLVWKGNPDHTQDAFRSIGDLQALVPLFQTPNIQWVSVQKGAGEAEAKQLAQTHGVANLGEKLTSFADTAALLHTLDLLITVDTSIAHLAGALNRPVWVLLPYYGLDWRWGIDNEETPWYPETMRLFRQGETESWQDVILRVNDALKDQLETAAV